MKRMSWLAVMTGVLLAPLAGADEQTYRLYDGITAFVNNPAGQDFIVTLDVRDINHRMHGPSELLVKVYPPDGKPVVRQIIEDDGVLSPTAGQPAAGWDHEAWYYATCYSRGLEPGVRWSAFSDPARLAAMPKRTFTWKIVGGQKGVYRVLLVGTPDHYATLRLDPDLKYGVAGSPEWLHGHGAQYRKAYVYVPKTTSLINVHFIQFDEPATRTFTVKDAHGTVLVTGHGAHGLNELFIRCAPEDKQAPATDAALDGEGDAGPGEGADEDPPAAAFTGLYDDQVLGVEVSDGPGDFLLNVTCQIRNQFVPVRAKTQAVTAILCPDVETAKALNGGAIYHDGGVFWQMCQVRLYDWLKQLKPGDFVFDQAKINLEGFHSVGSHNSPSFGGGSRQQRPNAISDLIMHHWSERKDPHELNAAIQDMLFGMRLIGHGDHVAIGPNRNLAYEGGCYTFFWYRPAWRIIQQSDAPQEVKDILREFIIQTGDRLAFCRTMATGNGNAFGSLMEALRYCAEASGDELQKKTFETCWDRFLHGGYGDRHGIGPSGGLQESNGYDYHYGSYVMRGWNAVIADLQDERFINARNRMWELYSYIDFKGPGGNPWSSRTDIIKTAGGYDPWGPFKWKGFGGPDLTVSVNDANEWFAARRANYYMVTYHGRLTPTWEGEGFHGQIGLGGGTICQLHIPNKGQVISGTPNGSYGSGMHLSQWRNFHVHGLVGTTTDGQPLVAANSEHANAKLEGVVVTSSGLVRQSSVEVSRRYEYGPTAIKCEVALQEAHHDNVFALWGGRPALRGKVTEAYEMIPFVDAPAGKAGKRQGKRTAVTLLAADNSVLGELDDASVDKPAKQAAAVLIDVGGYGVMIQFDDQLRGVQRGRNDTLLVTLANQITPASSVRFAYTLVPFTDKPPKVGDLAGGQREALTVASIGKVDDVNKVADLLAKVEPLKIMQKQVMAGTVQFTVAGDRLALYATVTDRQLERPATVWRGSCLEVFGSTPGSFDIGQVFLAPALADKPAAALVAQDGKQSPHTDIQVVSKPLENGYELTALIPLSLLKIDASKDSFLLEFQADSVLSGKARTAVTLFDSVHAYENNQRYGLFKVKQ